MADIIPMLDELHPLLSEERETHEGSPHLSRDAIDAVSDHSLESSDTTSESNNNDEDNKGVKNHEDSVVGNDDKKSKHADKEDETRSAILWTEYDQKNLITSEMERNRRLENLIARRRARKTMRMQAEKNLIDLETADDLPWNIPPISTARINSFDYDSNDNIPGSAPSVLLQRRNPFDLPYDSSKEKPDLVGDTFQQEFAVVQPKEPFFCRHESFNVGPSVFGASRSERQETRMKPYFVPERSFAELQRQFSGFSDSRVISYVPDTESVSSVGDLENKDHTEDQEHVSDHVRPYFLPETRFSTFQRQFSGLSDSKVSSVPDTESVSSDTDLENKDIQAEQGSVIRDDADLISESEQPLIEIEHVSDHQRPYFVPEFSDSKVSYAPDSESVSSDGDFENEDISQEQKQELMSGEDYVHASEIKEDESEQENKSFEDYVTRNLSSSSISHDLHKDESFQSSSSVTESRDSQNQVADVPDNKPVLETEDMDATHQVENVQISSLNSDEISHEEVMSQPKESLTTYSDATMVNHGTENASSTSNTDKK